MIRLRGKPFGPGAALGTASVLRAPNGIPMLPARLVAQMARARSDEPIEPIEVVLVAEDYETAAGLALPWARVVGIAARRVAPDSAQARVPAVIGLEGLMDMVGDDTLLLVDGDRGIVLVDPESTALAAYQAEHDRIAPRRRIHLGYVHQPARTLDGRLARVLACVATPGEVEIAVENGADALYVPAGSALLPAGDSDDEQYEALHRLSEMAVGLPVTLAGDAQSVAMVSLLRAAIRAELTLAVPLARGANGFAELQESLQVTRDALLAEEEDFADFRLAGATAPGEPLPDDLAACMVGRIVVEWRPEESLLNEPARNWLDILIVTASRLFVPVEVRLPAPDAPAVETALGLGAAGFIVAPEAVQTVKERLRALDASACRAALLGQTAERNEGNE